MRNVNISRPLIATLLIFSVFVFSGCGLFDSPQNVFSPAGTVARDQKNLFFVTMWPGVAVLALVEFGLVFILFRFRRRKTDTDLPEQVHGNNKLEIAWSIAPVILLAFFIAPTVSGIVDLGRTPKGAITIDVSAERFRWSYSYVDPNGGPPVVAQPGEDLHIPVDKTIVVRLHAVDVIHSFWVPRLAGKTDIIPGRTNHMWFNATEAGRFSGQCAEFCGTGHSDMRMAVTAESDDDFQAWLKAQVAAQPPSDEPPLVFQGD